jgi:RNA-directed DNA polymerase
MRILLKKSIEAEARKRIRAREMQLVERRRFRDFFQKRTGDESPEILKEYPKLWNIHKHYNPSWCLKNSNVLATGLYNSFLKDSYEPLPAARFSIKKPSGGEREIDVFSIPDAAISSLVFRNVLRRNQKVFSQNSYAFRSDKNVLDAVHYLRNYLRSPKIFIVEFDFENFFGSINHTYLQRAITQRNLFKLTRHERSYISSIILHQYFPAEKYGIGGAIHRTIGIPQGTSISLFLANVAAHELDRRLESANGVFARFSDDSVVLTNSYEDAIAVIGAYAEYSRVSGVKINYSKGGGIKMLSAPGPAKAEEMSTVDSFRYLNYQFSRSKISIASKKVIAIKRAVSKIIYNNLLLYLMRKEKFNKKRIGGDFYDWDLVTCINELRRYIYGGYKESVLNLYLSDAMQLRKARGVMSFFCLVDDQDQIRALDGWIVDAVRRALKHREKLLSGYGIKYKTLPKSQIVDGSWYLRASFPMETKCPSFFTAWRVARKRWEQVGSGGIESVGAAYE